MWLSASQTVKFLFWYQEQMTSRLKIIVLKFKKNCKTGCMHATQVCWNGSSVKLELFFPPQVPALPRRDPPGSWKEHSTAPCKRLSLNHRRSEASSWSNSGLKKTMPQEWSHVQGSISLNWKRERIHCHYTTYMLTNSLATAWIIVSFVTFCMKGDG